MEKSRPDKMNDGQKAAYLEAFMAHQQAAALQQQNKFRYDNIPLAVDDKKKSIPLPNGNAIPNPGKIFSNPISSCNSYTAPIKVPQLQTSSSSNPNLDSTFTVPDDGLGYDDGVRVLRTLGSW